MDIDITFNDEWNAIVNNAGKMLAPSIRKGLQRAGAAAMQNIGDNWNAGGFPKWRELSLAYAIRKKAGMVEPGRQVSTNGADNTLTGALRLAARYMPLTFWPNYHTLVIKVDPRIQRGEKPVGEYADAVNAMRPYYTLTGAQQQDVAEQFALGFMNALKGVPDPVGRHLGGWSG